MRVTAISRPLCPLAWFAGIWRHNLLQLRGTQQGIFSGGRDNPWRNSVNTRKLQVPESGTKVHLARCFTARTLID
jgi:hypothetical protein